MFLFLALLCFLSPLRLLCAKTPKLPSTINPLNEALDFLKRTCGDKKLSRNERFYFMLYLWMKYFNKNDRIPSLTSVESIVEFSKMFSIAIPSEELQKFELQMSIGFYPYIFLSEESET